MVALLSMDMPTTIATSCYNFSKKWPDSNKIELFLQGAQVEELTFQLTQLVQELLELVFQQAPSAHVTTFAGILAL